MGKTSAGSDKVAEFPQSKPYLYYQFLLRPLDQCETRKVFTKVQPYGSYTHS